MHPTTAPEIITEAGHRMDQTINALERDLSHIRAGRASSSLVDHIKVMAYGSEMPLNQLANISTPDATTIAIAPFDKGNLSPIEKALRLSELNLTPNNDGVMIRITLPPLTEDRRKELLKVVAKHGEEIKVALRNIRRDANDHLKRLEKAKELSEDELKRSLDQVDKTIERHLADIDKVLVAKQKEITEF